MAGEGVTRFVDSNIFIRMLARDDLRKAEACGRLFEAAGRGEVVLVTSESVVAEVFYVLGSPSMYALKRADLAPIVRALLLASRVHLEHKASVLAAIDLYETSNLDFEDCLSVQHVLRQHLEGIYSYDRGFGPALGITRFEP